MRAWKLAIPSAILSLGFLFCGTATYGKPEYAKKESKKCVDCHVRLVHRTVTPVYVDPMAMSQCLACHNGKSGAPPSTCSTCSTKSQKVSP